MYLEVWEIDCHLGAVRIKDISSEDIKQGTISSNLKYFHKRIKRSFNP